MGCVFCRALDVVFANDLAVAIFDKFPVHEGHMLVIPKRHVGSFFATTAEEKRAMLELVEAVPGRRVY